MRATALVVGGTGPTGPGTVNGLIRRGFEVTILHSGLHEVDFDADVEHIHADAHAADSLDSVLDGRTFDVAIAMYGRLRIVADALAGRAGRVIAVGGVFYAGWVNDQFHAQGEDVAKAPPPPYTFPMVPMPESAPMDSNPNNRFARRAMEAEQHVMALHSEGRFAATLLHFPKVYGPRAIAPIEWSIVRRALDRRPAIIVPDGGLVLETKVHAWNASAGVLAAVDHPDEAAGEVFNIGDDRATTTREWVSLLAGAVGHEFEFVSMPFDVAGPSFPYARDPWMVCHRVLDLTKLRTLLHWDPVITVEEGLAQTARDLAARPLGRGSEEELQVGDPFDYELEDRFVEAAAQQAALLSSLAGAEFRYRHPYRHPPVSQPE